MAERLATHKTKAEPAGNGGDGRPLAKQDNLSAILEAERVQLLSFVHKIIAQKREVKKAKEIHDGEKAKETELFRLAKIASPRFLRERLERYIGKLTGGARSRDIAEDARVDRLFEGWLSIPTGEEQLSLFSETSPIEVRDEAFWKAEGYLAYQRGELCSPPKDCPERHAQIWMKGWHDGEAATVWAMKMSEATPPAPPAPAPPEPDEFEASSEELAGQTQRRVLQEQRAAGEPEAV